MTDHRVLPVNDLGDSMSLWERQSHLPAGEDVVVDDVFEPPCSEEMDGSSSPTSSQHSHCQRGVVEGRVLSRVTPYGPLLSIFGSGFGMRGRHTSIISHLHPTVLQDATPTPPTSPGTENRTLLTLHSLSGGNDSGYVPSPSSAISFTFSSDEDEPPAGSLQQPRPGVTPPIAIPYTHRRLQPRPVSPPRTPPPEDLTPVRRGRTRSCPEQMSCPAPPRTPIPRFPRTLAPMVPSHGRTCSMPATGPDGKPLLTPSPESRNAVPRAARDALVDLAEEDGGSSSGHRRRVLVLALPDLVVDTQGRATGACTPPSSNPPSNPPSIGDRQSPRTPVSRPAWQRHRALSCDVTLEEEVGRALRMIADSFCFASVPTHQEIGEEGTVSVWGRLRNSFRRGIRSSLSSSDPSCV